MVSTNCSHTPASFRPGALLEILWRASFFYKERLLLYYDVLKNVSPIYSILIDSRKVRGHNICSKAQVTLLNTISHIRIITITFTEQQEHQQRSTQDEGYHKHGEYK